MLKTFRDLDGMIDNIGNILYTEIGNQGGKEMPVIARFYGIVIKMYLRQKEHNPPHIHAISGEYVGMFSLENGEMFEGDLPVKYQFYVKKFIEKYRTDLYIMWETQKFKKLPFAE